MNIISQVLVAWSTKAETTQSLSFTANITVKHKPNRAVIFDSALFHQTDKYRFKKGYKNGRINLTLLFGEMQKGEDSSGIGTADGSMKEEL